MLETVLTKRRKLHFFSYLSVRASWLHGCKKWMTRMEKRREEGRVRGRQGHKVTKKTNTV